MSEAEDANTGCDAMRMDVLRFLRQQKSVIQRDNWPYWLLMAQYVHRRLTTDSTVAIKSGMDVYYEKVCHTRIWPCGTESTTVTRWYVVDVMPDGAVSLATRDGAYDLLVKSSSAHNIYALHTKRSARFAECYIATTAALCWFIAVHYLSSVAKRDRVYAQLCAEFGAHEDFRSKHWHQLMKEFDRSYQSTRS